MRATVKSLALFIFLLTPLLGHCAGGDPVLSTSSSTADSVALFSGITGKLIKDSGVAGVDLTSLTDNSIANALHRHSELVASDGSPDPALSVDDAGKVGIGTTSPGEKLAIQGGQLIFQQSDTNLFESGRIRFTELAGTSYQGAFIHYDGSANVLNIGRHDTADEIVGNDANAVSILRNNGNVGIGTTNPSEKLDVVGNIQTSAESYVGPSTTTGVYFKGGNVGIRTTSPEAPLHLGADSQENMLRIDSGNNDRYIKFNETNTNGYGWRIGYQGTGVGDTNYLTFQSEGDSSDTWTDVLRLSLFNHYAIFGGSVGINTTSPGAKLDVNGNLILQNGVAVNEFSSDTTLGGNSDLAVPTEKAVKTYSDAKISNTAYGSGWNGVTGIAPSKDAVYDKIESMGGGADLWTDAGQYIYPNTGSGSGYRVLEAGTNLNNVTFASNTVYVLAPGADYNISSDINLSGSYTTLIGYGATIRKTAACMVRISGSHCKFVGFEVDGNSQNYLNVYVTGSYNEINGITSHHSASDSGISLTGSNCRFNTITNCVSYSNYKMGIALWMARYNTLSNNIAYSNSQDGFTCDGTPTYPAYGNIYVGNQSYNNANGFGIDSARHCTFTANHAFNNSPYEGFGLWGIEGSSSYLTFAGNTLNNNAGYGICLGPGTSCNGGSGSHASDHLKLVGNSYQSNGSGDYYAAGASNVEIIETAGSGGISNVVEDTTPQLGGSLDCNGHDIYLDNNDAIWGKNTSGTNKVIGKVDSYNTCQIGMYCQNVSIGEGSTDANGVKIHVNGSNSWIQRSPDTDSNGRHYLVVD